MDLATGTLDSLIMPRGNDVNDPRYPHTTLAMYNAKVPEAKAKTLFKGILNGLAEVHKANLAHSDIKPPNILLKGDEAWITDFDNAALVTGGTMEDVAKCMSAYGTGGFVSKADNDAIEEWTRDHQDRYPRFQMLDIYAAGAVLRQLRTGVYFRFKDDNFGEVRPVDEDEIRLAAASYYVNARVSQAAINLINRLTGPIDRRPTAAEALNDPWLA